MPQYLIILIAVVCVLAMVALIYMFFAFRRISIVAKKVDYLIEDLTYKSEILTPSVDAMIKLSSYVDVLEVLLKQNSQALVDLASNNKELIFKLSKQLQDIMKED